MNIILFRKINKCAKGYYINIIFLFLKSYYAEFYFIIQSQNNVDSVFKILKNLQYSELHKLLEVIVD